MRRGLERLDQSPDSLIDSGNRLIILGQLLSDLGLIGQVMWYVDSHRVEFHRRDTGVCGFVGEALHRSMRVGRAKIEKERSRIIFADEFLGVLGHADRIPTAADNAV